MRTHFLEALKYYCDINGYEYRSFQMGAVLMLPNFSIVSQKRSSVLQMRAYTTLDVPDDNDSLLEVYRVVNSIQIIRPTLLKGVYKEDLKQLEICIEIGLDKYKTVDEFIASLDYIISLFEILISVAQNYKDYTNDTVSKLLELIDGIK